MQGIVNVHFLQAQASLPWLERVGAMVGGETGKILGARPDHSKKSSRRVWEAKGRGRRKVDALVLSLSLSFMSFRLLKII